MHVQKKYHLCLLLTLSLIWPLVASAQLTSTGSGKTQDCVEPPTEEAGKLLFLTGPPDGNYFKMGNAIADVARFNKLSNLDVRCTNRTFENMRLLKPGSAAFALVQSDVAHAFWYGHTRYVQENANSAPAHLPYLVAPLYIEAVHILIRPHLNISSPAELRHRRVWLGPAHQQGPETGDMPPSGTEFTARRVLEAAGLSGADIDELENNDLDSARCPGDQQRIRDLDFPRARRALLNMCLDAMFSVGMVPNDKVKSVLDVPARPSTTEGGAGDGVSCGVSEGGLPSSSKTEMAEARLLSLDYPLVRRLVQDGSYVEKLIGRNDYCEDEPTLTVGVQALLLGRGDKANSKNIEQLATIVRSQRAKIEAKMGMKAPSNLSLLGMSVRPRLLTYAPRQEWPFVYSTWKAVWAPFFLACATALLALYWIVSLRRAYIGRLISENNLLIPAVVGLLLLWVGSAFLLNQFEGEVNERLSSFPRALRYSPLYISPSTGYPTLTENGQTTQRIGQWIVGVVLLGGVFAPFFTRKVLPQGLSQLSLRMMRRGAVRGNLKGHIVIINHSQRADDLIRQLHAQRIRNKRPVVVVSHSPVSFSSEAEFNDVFTVTGDVIDKAVLVEAQVERAHSVAILSAWPPPDPNDRRKYLRGDPADSKTVLGIQAVYGFLSTTVPTGTGAVSIVAELKSRKRFGEAKLAARDNGINLICEEDLGTELLTQCVATPGLTKLYRQLLSCSDNRSELRRVSLPAECSGRKFSDLIVYFANKRKSSKQAEIPIGIYREPDLFMNPADSELGSLKEADSLLIITENPSAEEPFVAPDSGWSPWKPAA